MGKLKYLSKNLALFTVSNFVSKILVFLLVPLYTNALTTYEYGVADILQVTLLLLVPALTMNIGEAALRFGIEKTDSRNSIFYTGIKYVLRADVIVTFVCIISMFFVPYEYKTYLGAFIFLFIANALYEFLILFFQGSEAVEIVVTGSVLCTVFTICFNLLFLLVLKISLTGYFLAQIIAYSFAGIIMIMLGKKAGIIGKKSSDSSLEKEMTDYSGPMIMYSTASWINNAVDRYFVAWICGAAVNGIYGVAYKIPAILMVFQRIFAQAWQMSATKSYGDNNSDQFFTVMYKAYNSFMVVGCGVLILIVKPLSEFLFRKDFFEAWRVVPPLLISVIFGALTGFLGSICLAHKDSKSMGYATSIGAATNIVLNLLLIPRFGAMGAAVATAVSYFVMSSMAYKFVSKHVSLKIKLMKFYLSYLLIVIEAFVIILEIDLCYVISALLVLAITGLYFAQMKELFMMLISKIKKA